MSRQKDEDDKTTTMLDINELKKQNDASSQELSQILEFSAVKNAAKTQNDIKFENSPDSTVNNANLSKKKPKCIMFDFKGQFFSDNLSSFNAVADCIIVTDLKQLNKLIVANKTGNFVFYFNDASKPINALLAQINQKFPQLNTVLIAKNLSTNKAKLHAKSPSGAKQYLSWPTTDDKILGCLKFK